MSEVGLSHSSDEVGESLWSEGDNKFCEFQEETCKTQEVCKSVGKELKDIGYQSKTYAKVQTLMNHVNEETIKDEHRKQVKKKATGVDGVGKEKYGEELDKNVKELISNMKKFSYKPLPVRRVYIPKGNGKQRPLGIPAYEDKLVQGVMARLLNEVYEERFLECSYGYRPNKSAHDVVKYINNTIMTKKVNYVLETDIKGFFDNVNHNWLMKFLENDIQDKNFLRYIKRFLIAGVMEEGIRKKSDKGTPQGGSISPVLANVYLHYVLDLWSEKKLKKEVKGEIYYVRYADDELWMFQYENDAKHVLNMLRQRLEEFGLEVAEEKTRIIPIGRFKGTKDDFDFLGFTFFNTKTREGKYRLGVRTSKKKLKAKKEVVKAWIRTRLTKPIARTMELINMALRGHYNYYGISGNYYAIQKFYKYIKYSCYRMLNRRSQKRSMRYDKFLRIWNYYIDKPRLKVDIWNWN